MNDPTLSGDIFDRLGQLHDKGGTLDNLDDFIPTRALQGFSYFYDGSNASDDGSGAKLITRVVGGRKYASLFDRSVSIEEGQMWLPAVADHSVSELSISGGEVIFTDTRSGLCANRMSIHRTTLADGTRLLVGQDIATGDCEYPTSFALSRFAVYLP
jgi:hypothetical protein